MASLKKIFNQYNQLAGKIFSDVNFDFYRPDYKVANQSLTLIASNKSVRFDTRAAQWAEPALAEGMYYDLFLNRKIIQAGDILVPTGLSPTASTIGPYPVITVESISALKPCVGLLTDHIGYINDGETTNYTNVRWQWGSIGQPKQSGDRSVIADVFPFDRRKAIMYRRQNVGLPVPIQKGNFLYEYVDAPGGVIRWRIMDMFSSGNFTVLQVEEDNT